MKKTNHNFYVFPTLVDSFLWMERVGTPDKFQELIDKINRVPFEMPEHVKRGMAFEDCVNLRVKGQKIYTKDGFEFDDILVDKIAAKLQNTIGMQKWIEKTVPFKYGNVRIGGFLDYDYSDKSVDLKTTSNYRLGKYTENQQHKAYGLIESHKTDFVYLVSDMQNMYIEPYKNKKIYHEEFLFNTERLYEFVEDNRELITDTKIFGN